MFVKVKTYLLGRFKNHFSFRLVDKTEFYDESRISFNVCERGHDRVRRTELRKVCDGFAYGKGPQNHQ